MKKLTIILLTSFLFVNCSEDDFVSNPQGDSRYITFMTNVTEMEDLDVTRGGGHHNAAHHHDMTGAATPMFARFTQTNNIDKYLKANRQDAQGEKTTSITRGRRIDSIPDFYDAFGLIYFRYLPTESWVADGSTFTPYVYNEKVRRADGWRTKEYWPGSGGKLTFFAYAPYNAEGITLSSATDTGTPWLHYEVPLNAQDENDLLISANEHEVGNYNAIRHIDFRHICAGVRFGIGNQMAPGTITKIQLADVYGEGWYHFGATAWDSVKTKKTFTLNQSFNISKGEKNKLLTTGDNVFMMVPQKVPGYARILVTINDGEEHELESLISFDEWDMGTTTTYWLSTLVTDGDTILYVSVENAPIAATGGTAQYHVGSYYTTAYGTRSPIPWTATYTIDNDTTTHSTLDMETLSAFTFSGGFSPVESNNITAKAGKPISASSITYQLKHRSIKNEDLAIGSDKKGSANCYVVNNPGTYTFPIVYGSSLDKNGNTVSSVYSSDHFVNHAGTKINTIGPRIPESEIDHAIIVWQDAKHLVTPSSLEIVNKNGFKCIQFSIDTLNICEGNAVIAVRNASNEIMWSWHIWVTINDINKTIRIYNNDTGTTTSLVSNLSPIPLGFCERDTFRYTPHKIHLKISQSTSGNTAEATISQISGDAYSYGVSATYYQWGRKDPMPPGTGNYDNAFKTLYDNISDYTRVNSLVDIPIQSFQMEDNSLSPLFSTRNPIKLYK